MRKDVHRAPEGLAMKRQVSGMMTAPTMTPPTTAETTSPREAPPDGARARISPIDPVCSETRSINRHTTPRMGTMMMASRLMARRPTRVVSVMSTPARIPAGHTGPA